jgi:hypothetical protein
VVDGHSKKEKIPIDNEPKGKKLVDSRLGKKKDMKKCIKKIVYYKSDMSTSLTTLQKEDSSTKHKMVKISFNYTPLYYSCISCSSNARLLSTLLGKRPHFGGEYYSWWSHKMCSHLFLLHPCIWDIVEIVFNIPDVDDENYNQIEVELIHRNAQATTILLASLCRKEHNKVNSLENAKEIWDTLCIAHERKLDDKNHQDGSHRG